MYERSWVRILALYTGCTFGHFSHLFGVKIIIVFEKTENKQKEAAVGPFKKLVICSLASPFGALIKVY